MADSPFRERHYRSEEVRAVVRRALELEGRDAGSGRALSRAEVERLLAELGVSAEAAARSLDEGKHGARVLEEPAWSLLGGPRRVVLEEEMQGELAEDRHEDVAEAMRDTFGDFVMGRVEAIGRTLTWTPTGVMSAQRRLSVRIRSRDGRTRLRVEEDLTPQRVGAWIGFPVGGGFSLSLFAIAIAVVNDAPALGLLAVVLLMTLSCAAAFLTTRWVARRRKEQLARLFDKLKAEVARGSRPRARIASAPADSSAEDEAAEEEAAAAAAPPALSKGGSSNRQ